jgi:hypothetical protein
MAFSEIPSEARDPYNQRNFEGGILISPDAKNGSPEEFLRT